MLTVDYVPPVPPYLSGKHDGADTTGYRLLVDGQVAATKPVSELVDGEIKFPLEGTGVHEMRIEAYRDSEVSDPITVDLGS